MRKTLYPQNRQRLLRGRKITVQFLARLQNSMLVMERTLGTFMEINLIGASNLITIVGDAQKLKM